MTTVPLDLRPARHPEVVIGLGSLRGAAYHYAVKDGRTGNLYQLGAREQFVLARLDGVRTLEEIGAEYAEHFGRRLGDGAWRQLLGLFGSRGLLATESAEPAAVSKPTPAPRRRVTGALRGDVVFYNPSGLVHALNRLLRPFLTRWVAVPVLLVFAAAQVLIVARTPQLLSDYQTMPRHVELFPVVICLYWLCVLVHEVGHGLAAVRFGGDATELGLRWGLPFIGMYCTVEDVPLFRSRRHQAATALAGVAAGTIFELPFLAIWLALPAGSPTRAGIGVLLLYVTISVLSSLVPVPTMDGYKALEYALGFSGLAAESRRYVRALLRRDGSVRDYPRRAAVVYTAYSAAFAVGVLAALAEACVLVATWRPSLFDWLNIALVAVFLAARVPGALLRRRSAGTLTPSPAVTPPTAPASLPFPTATETRMRPALSNDAPPAVVVENVSRAYGPVQACRGVSLTVARGEMLGVLGPNGAGKTTLIEMMEGLRRPDSGRIEVFGAAPWPRHPERLLRVGVQNQASAFFTRLTAREHLETVAVLYGRDRKAAHAVLERFGLAGSAGTRVERLSGGQRQRLALAAALVHDPDLLFLDEPTAALDPQARRELWQLMREIRDEGKTIVYTTHHLDEAEALCDRVAVMSSGTVVAVGEPAELIGSLGDSVRVLVPSERLTVDAALAIAGVDAAVAEGACVAIATRTPGPVLTAVTEIVGIQGVRTRTTTLEDVYLSLTGTEYQA